MGDRNDRNIEIVVGMAGCMVGKLLEEAQKAWVFAVEEEAQKAWVFAVPLSVSLLTLAGEAVWMMMMLARVVRAIKLAFQQTFQHVFYPFSLVHVSSWLCTPFQTRPKEIAINHPRTSCP